MSRYKERPNIDHEEEDNKEIIEQDLISHATLRKPISKTEIKNFEGMEIFEDNDEFTAQESTATDQELAQSRMSTKAKLEHEMHADYNATIDTLELPEAAGTNLNCRVSVDQTLSNRKERRLSSVNFLHDPYIQEIETGIDDGPTLSNDKGDQGGLKAIPSNTLPSGSLEKSPSIAESKNLRLTKSDKIFLGEREIKYRSKKVKNDELEAQFGKLPELYDMQYVEYHNEKNYEVPLKFPYFINTKAKTTQWQDPRTIGWDQKPKLPDNWKVDEALKKRMKVGYRIYRHSLTDKISVNPWQEVGKSTRIVYKKNRKKPFKGMLEAIYSGLFCVKKF